jgi:Bacterial type II/III secretion system short domain
MLPALGIVVLLASAAAAQPRAEALVLEAIPLQYQPVEGAAGLIAPLLSERGSLSLQRDDNTLVVRDRASVLATVREVLREFDHPPRAVQIRFYLLRARRAETGGVGARRPSELPPSVAEALGSMLNFNVYELLGSSEVRVREGQSGEVMLGSDHKIHFLVGTVLRERRLPLRGFEVTGNSSAASGRSPVFASDLLLKGDKAFLLTISSTLGSSSGLVLAMDWHLPTAGVSPVASGPP